MAASPPSEPPLIKSQRSIKHFTSWRGHRACPLLTEPPQEAGGSAGSLQAGTLSSRSRTELDSTRHAGNPRGCRFVHSTLLRPAASPQAHGATIGSSSNFLGSLSPCGPCRRRQESRSVPAATALARTTLPSTKTSTKRRQQLSALLFPLLLSETNPRSCWEHLAAGGHAPELSAD